MNQESKEYHVRYLRGVGYTITHKATGNTKIQESWTLSDSASEAAFDRFCAMAFQ